jgi:Ca2+-binding EF-hand superfamily protein
VCTATAAACAYQYFDVDGDGIIEYEEFVNTLKRLDIGLSDSQVRY